MAHAYQIYRPVPLMWLSEGPSLRMAAAIRKASDIPRDLTERPGSVLPTRGPKF